MKKKLALPASFLLLAMLVATAFRNPDASLDTLLASLAQWNTLAPQEKVHLHLDKPYYSVGEDIWLKAYVVDANGNLLSDHSKILYIDLLDERDSVKQSLLLPIENGTASGNVHLSDSLLSAGNYHICAYTKWMQNFGSEYFFKKDISIVNALKGAGNSPNTGAANKNKALATIADVQFFPEGGHLVNGIRTKIGFKALKPDGLGENINGYITDGGEEHLAEFSTEHAGMGVFALIPVAGRTYTAVIMHTDGSEKRYKLPKADESGYVLNMNHAGADSLSVKVSASPGLLNGKEAVLIAQCNGVVKFVAKLRLDQASNLSYISTKKIPTGIVQFTLFNPEMLPVAERLVFVQHNDQLNAEIKTDKTEYAQRGKVNLSLNVTDRYGEATVGSFSVAVTDESKVKTDDDAGTGILSDLLLTSDIKGYIEQPNYYFNPNNPQREKQLDNLLLTQGWRRFSWADILNNKFPAIKYQPEQSLEVTGMITTIGNKPVPKGKVTLFAKTGGLPLIIDTVADENGHFAFTNMYFPDSAQIMVKATNAQNGTFVKTIINKKPQAVYAAAPLLVATGTDNRYLAAYTAATSQQFDELSKFGLMKNTTMLKQVNIKAIKERDKFTMEKIIPHSSNIDPGNADYVLKGEKLERTTYLIDALLRVPGLELNKGLLFSVRAELSFTGSKPMMIILDGAQISQKMMNSIPPADMAGVEILTGGSKALYGLDGVGGVIIITTKRGDDIKQIDNSFNKQHYTPQGYSAVKQFYSPAYDTPDQSKMADLRSTIYWNPDVVTGADGKASFSFYNADGTGTYKVTLEGMDTKGGLLRKVFTYVVK